MRRGNRQRYTDSLAAACARQPSQGAVRTAARTRFGSGGVHPLTNGEENRHLYQYEKGSKDRFDLIVPTLKQISALQHEPDFVQMAQAIAQKTLGYELPAQILQDAWVDQLDMRRLFAWCVFITYQQYADDFIAQKPLAVRDAENFAAFLQSCGFHLMDITPCADGRLAHVTRYVLRLPGRAARRKSYAGAMFDIEENIQKWVEVELSRFREGQPNTADAPTGYLKIVAYHHSSVDPDHQGCAAHGSDTAKAAAAGLDKLENFEQAIENGFCCGAAIDTLLIGVDTDTDSVRIHVPDGNGKIDLERYVDVLEIYEATKGGSAGSATEQIREAIQRCSPEVAAGMSKLIEYLVENNLSQIDYVRAYHGSHYSDIGHAERFIGAGVGFEDIQLRNLMYFAYMDTVEESVADLDVGVKIFTGLNVSHGLPVPIVVRYDYHGNVPGSRERSVRHCERVDEALRARYSDLAERGMLHTLQVVRDCDASTPIEVVGCSAMPDAGSGH